MSPDRAFNFKNVKKIYVFSDVRNHRKVGFQVRNSRIFNEFVQDLPFPDRFYPDPEKN